MAHEGAPAEIKRERGRDRRYVVLAILGLVLVIALAITLYGGYGPGWKWTGYENAELWDWLHVLLLPIAFGLVAILVHAEELGSWRWVIGLTCLGLFIVLVVAGYTIPWNWTGFVGNTVWDWLELALLPLTLSVLAAFKFDVRAVQGHHLFYITAFIALVTVLAIGGYTQGWDWTGFKGNTLFDWLKLLFLPVVIPLVVIPSVVALRERSAREHVGQP
jgi:hypothetical protein